MKTPSLKPATFENVLWIGSHIALLMALLAWFYPGSHPACVAFDEAVFYSLNGSLNAHPLWQWFWGILNHRREVPLNLVLAVLLNCLAILKTTSPDLKKQRIRQTVYFWICFEIGFRIQDLFFNHWLSITRLSPSLVLEPVLKLSEVLHIPRIKDSSMHSFPGGHAFALLYWASFTQLCAPKKIARMGMGLSLILSSARLFSGAHWFSDVLFSYLLALVWLSWTLKFPLYRTYCLKKAL